MTIKEVIKDEQQFKSKINDTEADYKNKKELVNMNLTTILINH
jgi:hypothetical protein